MTLTDIQQKFVLHWGEMGSRWGINRTVAQIHALLFISKDPLNADDIAQTLAVARSNVSTSLRELQGWGIVQAVPILGERKDHFTTQTDVWEMFVIVLDERKKREIDPTLSKLRSLLIAAESNGESEDPAVERIRETTELMELLTGWYEEMNQIPTERLVRLLALGATVQKVLSLPDRVADGLRRRGEPDDD